MQHNRAAQVALSLLVLTGLMSLGLAAHAARAADPPLYTVKDGKMIDKNTYKGFLYYGDQCHRCHGPDGAGSAYAPVLVDSLKRLSKEQFQETVINGKREVSASNTRVMPSFGLNVDVVQNLDNIYAYLKARSDGVLKRGHPEHLEQ